MSQVAGIPSSVYAPSENYVLIGGYDIYDRAFHKKLLNRVPKYGALTWMRAVKGYMSKRKTRRHQYYYYEEGQWMSAAATIASTTDQTTYVDIVLSSADHEDSGARSFPVVGQTVVFEDESVGYVFVVNRATPGAHFVSVKPVNSGTNILAAAVAGTTMVFYSNAQKEKSTETEGRIPKVSKVTNYVQTFREKYEVTDHAEQNEVEFTYKGQNFLYVKGIDDTMDRFMMQEDFGLLINDSSESLTDAGGNAIQLAKGLIPQITDNGITMEYFGDPDKSTIDDAVLLLNKNFGDHDYIIGQSLKVSQKQNNWLVDFAKNGDNNISFNAFETREQALALNFTSIFMEPYSFHFQTWDVFTHADTLGAGNMPYQDMMIFIPTGKTKNPEPEEGFGDYEPYLQLVYSRIPGAPHENKGDYKMWETGANARSGATDDELTRAIHMASWKSLEVRCRNKFLIARKAA